jgi:hypothetical protein
MSHRVTITSEIIPQKVSVPHNANRLVQECRYKRPDPMKSNGER